MFDKPSNRELLEELEYIRFELKLLLGLVLKVLHKVEPEVTGFIIIQGDTPNMANSITGIPVGGKGSFTALPVPAGSVILGGAIPVFVSDSPLAVVSNSADGLSTVVTVDPSAVVGQSFNLSISVTNSDGSVASGTASVPFLAAPPPPPVQVTSFDINQTA